MRCPRCDSALTPAEAGAGACPDCAAPLAPGERATPAPAAAPAGRPRSRLAVPAALLLGAALGAGGVAAGFRVWRPEAADATTTRAEPDPSAEAARASAAEDLDRVRAEAREVAAERAATEHMLGVVRDRVQATLGQLAAAEKDRRDAESKAQAAAGRAAAAESQAREAETRAATMKAKAGELERADATVRATRAKQEEAARTLREAEEKRAAADRALADARNKLQALRDQAAALDRELADKKVRGAEADKTLAVRRTQLADVDRAAAAKSMTPAKELKPAARTGAVSAPKAAGFVRDWLVVGPFPAPDRKGHTTYFPTQAGPVDPDKEYKAGGGPVRWRAHASPTDYVDFAALFKTQDPAVGYAVCWVRPAKPCSGQLRLGSNDGIIVWVNGKVVSDKAVSRSAAPDQDRAVCELTADWNELRVKVDNTGGPWGFYLDFRDPANEKPLGGLEFRTTPPSAKGAR